MQPISPLLQVSLYAYGTACIVVASLRWLRVAQREHYIPGSVAEFAIRWWTVHWGNLALLACFAGLAALSIAHPLWGAAALTLLVFLPAGIDLRGRTSKLAWTPRMRRLCAAVAIAYLGAAGLGWLGGRPGYVFFVLSGAASPAVVDLALILLAPVEKALSNRYVVQASKKLRRIGPKVIALTGSYGKTTTKNYVAHILEPYRRTFATPASYNNRLGIAKAINESMPEGTEVFVAEVGTYGRGEIAEIVSWLHPDIAGLLVVGPVHLERFGSIRAIAEAKAEIFEGASVLVVNWDDQEIRGLPGLEGRGLAERSSTLASGPENPSPRGTGPGRSSTLASGPGAEPKVLWFSSKDPSADVYVERGEDGEATLFVGGQDVARFDSRIHLPQNVAAAAALACACGLEPGQIGSRISTLPEVEHRRSVSRTDAGIVIVDDTFNSNPEGARRALDLLASQGEGSRRKVVVTPGMVELGDLQDRENRSFAKEVCSRGFELIVVGFTNRKALVEGAREAGAEPAAIVDTREEAVAWVRANLGSGDAVLYENDLPDHYP